MTAFFTEGREESKEVASSSLAVEHSANDSCLMHPLFHRADRISKEVIGGAIEVHRDKGPGLIESIYQHCLEYELGLRGFSVSSQHRIQINYKDLVFDEVLRYDLLVDECLLIELKAVERILPIHKAQLLSYMKLMDVPIGLLINYNVLKLTDGVSRLILPGVTS